MGMPAIDSSINILDRETPPIAVAMSRNDGSRFCIILRLYYVI